LACSNDLDIQNRNSVQADAGSLTVAFDLSGYLPKESR
jgi:hypothetical protein